MRGAGWAAPLMRAYFWLVSLRWRPESPGRGAEAGAEFLLKDQTESPESRGDLSGGRDGTSAFPEHRREEQ